MFLRLLVAMTVARQGVMGAVDPVAFRARVHILIGNRKQANTLSKGCLTHTYHSMGPGERVL